MGKTLHGRSLDDLLAAFSESISFDQALYRHDIAGSRAHARMLAQVGLFRLLASYFRSPSFLNREAAEGKSEEDPRKHWSSASVTIMDLALLAALPLGALWISRDLVPQPV